MISNNSIEERVIKLTSRNYFGVCVLLLFLSIVLRSNMLSNLLYVLFAIFWIIPGVIIWIQPKYSLAWFNGLKNFIFPDSWDKLGSAGKVILYANSILGLIVGVLILLWLGIGW